MSIWVIAIPVAFIIHPLLGCLAVLAFCYALGNL